MTRVPVLDRSDYSVRWEEVQSDAGVDRLLPPWTYGNSSAYDAMELIAKSRGWHPLEVGQEMSVGFYGKRYTVKRTS